MNSPADASDRTPDPNDNSDDTTEVQSPGWMPAIVAALALFGMIGFIVCAFSTWVLFQKRTEFAIRTLQGDYIRQLEQSQLDPATKASVQREIESLIADLERGKYENWQAAAIMQRLQRLPVFQWGELQAIEAYLKNSSSEDLSDEDRGDGLRELGRLRRAVELGKVTSFDLEDALQPVRRPSPNSPSGFELIQPLELKGVRESIRRARLLADRAAVPNDDVQEVRIVDILHSEIERAATEGGY